MRVRLSLDRFLVHTWLYVTTALRQGARFGGQVVDEISNEPGAGDAADCDRDADAGLLRRCVVAGEEPAAAEGVEGVVAEGIAVEGVRGGVGDCRCCRRRRGGS